MPSIKRRRNKPSSLLILYVIDDPPDLESQSLRKAREQEDLIASIELFGVNMLPCFSCENSGARCRLDSERSTRCSECVRLRKACNVVVPLAAF